MPFSWLDSPHCCLALVPVAAAYLFLVRGIKMYAHPTQSVPGGFIFVFFGVLSWIYSGLAGYASWLVFHRHYIEHKPVDHNLSSLAFQTGIGFIVGLLLIYFGLRMASKVAPYDTRDPKEPFIKF